MLFFININFYLKNINLKLYLDLKFKIIIFIPKFIIKLKNQINIKIIMIHKQSIISIHNVVYDNILSK